MGASERPEREGERGEQPIAERQRELGRLQRRRDRQRQDGVEGGGDAERQRSAEHEPDRAAERRQQQDLGKIDREHAAAGRAQRLQGRDHVALALDVALHRVGDADPADQERRQADQRQELGEALDVALQRRRRIVAGANLPSGLGQLRFGRLIAACAARSLPSASLTR